MPRQLRIDYPGAIHHVMSRGDRRENIYHDDVDRQDFLKTLAEVCQKTDWQVHAYCLMSNHFHLALETPNASLVEGMHWRMSTHTIRLNRRHEVPGHVFSGRYKELVVEGDEEVLKGWRRIGSGDHPVAPEYREAGGIGEFKSANAKLHTWMQTNGKPDGVTTETKSQKEHARKTNQTKA